ncbi:hypothetical protein [Novipirellula sp.]
MTLRLFREYELEKVVASIGTGTAVDAVFVMVKSFPRRPLNRTDPT